MNLYLEIVKVFDGGLGSGNYGHGGRPGKVGGSSDEPSGLSVKQKTSRKVFEDKLDREVIQHPEKHSLGKYVSKSGRLKSERAKLHYQILDEFTKDVKKTNTPICYFTGGGSASGKGSVAKLLPEFPSEENKSGVIIDADEIKKHIPEYDTSDPNSAGYVHEESSILAKELTSIVYDSNDCDSLVDGTLAGSPEKVRAKILQAKATGNPVVGAFVTVDLDKALQRNYERYLRTGRLPSIDTLLKTHRESARNFQQVHQDFDKVSVIDTNGSGEIIAESIGGKLRVYNKQAYNNYKKKANISQKEEQRLVNEFKKKVPEIEKAFYKKNPDIKKRKRPNF